MAILLNLVKHSASNYDFIPWMYMYIYTTIAALYAKICPQNRTDFYPHGLNSTAIIASIFLSLHITSPRPLDRSLFAFVLSFFTTKNQKEFRIATVEIFRCDLYAAVFRQMSPPPPTKNCSRLRTTTHDNAQLSTMVDFYSFTNKISFHGSKHFIFTGSCSATHGLLLS